MRWAYSWVPAHITSFLRNLHTQPFLPQRSSSVHTTRGPLPSPPLPSNWPREEACLSSNPHRSQKTRDHPGHGLGRKAQPSEHRAQTTGSSGIWTQWQGRGSCGSGVREVGGQCWAELMASKWRPLTGCTNRKASNSEPSPPEGACPPPWSVLRYQCCILGLLTLFLRISLRLTLFCVPQEP